MPTPPVGVIEALASGFDAVASRLVLILIPVLLDVFLWAGPRLTTQPILSRFYENTWLPTIAAGETRRQEAWEPFSEVLAETSREENPQYLPSGGTPTLMTMRAILNPMPEDAPAAAVTQTVPYPPSENDSRLMTLAAEALLFTARAAAALPFDYTPPVWRLRYEWEWLGVMVGALVIGSLFTTLQIGMVGQQVQEGHVQIGDLIRRLPVTWLRLVGFGLVIAVIMGAVGFPCLILASMAAVLAGLEAANATMAFGALTLLWLGVFVFFSIHGIVMFHRGVLGSLWDSIRVVQWNLPATMGLMILVVTLGGGLSLLWVQAPEGSWLALLAIVANAFVTTGLIAATCAFFQDRYRYWKEIRAVLLANPEQLLSSKDRGGKKNGA